MCRLVEVSRAGSYRHWQAAAPAEEETGLRDRLQTLALAHRHYGYRRLGPLLRREGWAVNPKRVLRLLREDNLLCLRRKACVPPTTDRRHRWPIYPNLARRLLPTAVNQLWVADITYVRLAEAFGYLAVILDAHSRRAVGWAMAEHLRAERALEALQIALAGREVIPGGLVHHSDRGVQYACGEYIALLAARGIQPSMSRAGCPYDNAMAESFMKTLKQEEVDGRSYRQLAEAKASIGTFIEEVYNRQRLHSALDYLAPAEFETITAPWQPTVPNSVSHPWGAVHEWPLMAHRGALAVADAAETSTGTSEGCPKIPDPPAPRHLLGANAFIFATGYDNVLLSTPRLRNFLVLLGHHILGALPVTLGQTPSGAGGSPNPRIG